ncbi:mucin-3B-like [Cygnus olor]|nr:mucin-3B-like [Cygnus olor]
MSNAIRCVTKCTANTPITLDCYHGQCHVTRAGPQCFCWDESLYWYTGTQCSGRISKVATGLGLVATVLLISCIVFVVLLVKRRKEWRRNASSSIGDSWYENDGGIWTSPDGFLFTNNGASAGGSLRSFTPSLDLVNTDMPMHIARPSLRPPP